jgi:broad specificity phosphatase PhoE
VPSTGAELAEQGAEQAEEKAEKAGERAEYAEDKAVQAERSAIAARTEAQHAAELALEVLPDDDPLVDPNLHEFAAGVTPNAPFGAWAHR